MLTIELPELSFVDVPLERERVQRTVRGTPAKTEQVSDNPPISVSIGVPIVQRITAETVAEDRELRSFIEQSSDTRFSLIQLACCFRPDEDRPFRKARLTARLYADNAENEQQRPIAWSLDPRVLAESVQTVRKTTLSTGLKFFDVGITGGGEVTETTNRSVPFLEAFGELESEPYWEFTRTPSRDIRGPFRFSMIVKSSGADQSHADFAIRTEVEITRFGFRTYRTAAAGVDALKVRLA
jgi:hypothetical protein